MRRIYCLLAFGFWILTGCAVVSDGNVRDEKVLILEIVDQEAGKRLDLTARCHGAPQSDTLFVECRIYYKKPLPTEGENHVRTGAMRNLESMVRGQFSQEGVRLELIEMGWAARDLCPDTFKYLYLRYSTLEEI